MPAQSSIRQTLNDLIVDLKNRRAALVNDPPPVLLLGAGASIESGIGSMDTLIKHFNCRNKDQFFAKIRTLGAQERYRYLSEFLAVQQPSKVTKGYQALAALCAEKYFDIVLTTNFDPLIDDALTSVKLWRKDYLILINGVIRSDRLDLLMNSSIPRVKVIKLHGDLFHRWMAWTPNEMKVFIRDIIPYLNLVLRNRDILVVGHALNDSPHIRRLVLERGGTIWYTHPTTIPDFQTSGHVKVIKGPECKFERLFTTLATKLGIKIPSMISATKTPPSTKLIGVSKIAQTMDDLMTSIVGIAGPDGNPYSTGFILAQPPVIVTDGFSVQYHIHQDQKPIIAYNGRRIKCKVIKKNLTHPFGPFILQVPKQVKALGLRMDTRPLKSNLPVHIAVAAGPRIGVSSGVIDNPNEERLQIDPVGNVDHLIAIDCVVAPGSSGAPVVDSSFGVRGFIVAGRHDRPPSHMYPAYRWINMLEQKY